MGFNMKHAHSQLIFAKKGRPSQLLMRLCRGLCFCAVALFESRAYAVGTGSVVQGGVQEGPRINGANQPNLVIQQTSQNVVINWDSFNINAGEAVTFNQPNRAAAALNNVYSADPTQILGTLKANGRIFIVNPNGVVFGQGASVDVGGLVASTLSINQNDFMNGNYAFAASAGTVPPGVVTVAPGVNITAKSFVALLGASQVSNAGTITAGTDPNADSRGIALVSASAATIQLGNWNVVVDQATQNALVQNSGDLIIGQSQADGSILLSAQGSNALMQALLAGSVTNLSQGANSKISLTSSGTTEVGGEISAAAGAVDIQGRDITLSGNITAGSDDASPPVSVIVGDQGLTNSVTQTEASTIYAMGQNAAIQIAARNVLDMSGALLAPNGQISLAAPIVVSGLLLSVADVVNILGKEVLALLPIYTEDSLAVYLGVDGGFYAADGRSLDSSANLYADRGKVGLIRDDISLSGTDTSPVAASESPRTPLSRQFLLTGSHGVVYVDGAGHLYDRDGNPLKSVVMGGSGDEAIVVRFDWGDMVVVGNSTTNESSRVFVISDFQVDGGSPVLQAMPAGLKAVRVGASGQWVLANAAGQVSLPKRSSASRGFTSEKTGRSIVGMDGGRFEFADVLEGAAARLKREAALRAIKDIHDADIRAVIERRDAGDPFLSPEEVADGVSGLAKSIRMWNDAARIQWQTQESIDALGLAKLASDAAAKQALLDQEKVALDGRRLEAQKRELADAQARAKGASDQAQADAQRQAVLDGQRLEAQKRESDDAQARAKAASDQ
ncbi:filamentous hemagglutinin N-terminal domain-containing protein, partial [Pandoraea sp. SD6-2]|uniref:two-partner secretion domain-containing protein n=1 Tax=Pandoraea sp. SD6-2 TaxID=1286093 RepID=UPI0003308602